MQLQNSHPRLFPKRKQRVKKKVLSSGQQEIRVTGITGKMRTGKKQEGEGELNKGLNVWLCGACCSPVAPYFCLC